MTERAGLTNTTYGIDKTYVSHASHKSHGRWLACAIGVGLLLTAGRAHAEPLSVMQFNEKIKGWKEEQKAPPPLTHTVEGRVTLVSKETLRLMRCDVRFHLRTEIPELSRKSSNIEVTGKVVVDPQTKEYVFEVASAREVPSDVEKYRELSRKLRQQPAEKWYELGKWAETRGNFYNDHELKARSQDAYREGIDLEHKALARGNPQGLLDLAEKARAYEVAPTLRTELAHEAFFRMCERSPNLKPEELEELAKKMVRSLPGCTEALAFLPTELNKKYRASPLEFYAAADAPTRRKIHRLLYSDILLRTITPKLAADGSNGFEVAAEIAERVPEQSALADSYRDKALAAQASDVKKLTRSQVVELADQYRSRNQPKAAERVIESWLTIRQRELEPDDTEGLLNLVDDYGRMLKRQEFANRLLIDAWRRNPKAPDIVARLVQEGYHLDQGNWLTTAEYNARPEGQLEKAIRAGRVEPGMTVSHVRRSLGEPISIGRAVTAGQVTEMWTYSATNVSHLVVRLVKRAGQSELTVVDVVQGRAP